MGEYAESDVCSDVEGPVDPELYDLAVVIESAGMVLPDAVEQFKEALESGRYDEESIRVVLHTLAQLEDGLSGMIRDIMDYESEP